MSIESTEAMTSRTVAPAARDWRSSIPVVLSMLFIVSMFNFIDRQLPFILAESIRRDLALTDTQLGLLGGIAFAVIYSTASIPLAMLADRWSAKWTLVGSLSIWSLLTALAGFAQNFWQLALSRTGVAAGEAGCTPAAHSIISSLIPSARRGVAIAVFTLGVPVGNMVGLVVGGWLNDSVGWRVAMFSIGIPGILFAILCALTLVDARPVKKEQAHSAFGQAARELLRLRSYLHMLLGVTVYGIGIYGVYAFSAPFLIRTHSLSASEAGLWLGLAVGIGGTLSVIVGGWLTDRIGRDQVNKVLWLPAAGFAVAAPVIVAACFVPNVLVTVLLLGIFQFGVNFWMPPVYATAQRLASPQSRAIASGMLVFGMGFFGGSFGPLLIGMISDLLSGRFGADSLRYAVASSAVMFVWAIFHMLAASRSLARDVAVVDARS